MRIADICEIAICLAGLYLVGLGLLMLYGITEFDVSRYTDPSSIGILALGISGISMVLTFRRIRLDRMVARQDQD